MELPVIVEQSYEGFSVGKKEDKLGIRSLIHASPGKLQVPVENISRLWKRLPVSNERFRQFKE